MNTAIFVLLLLATTVLAALVAGIRSDLRRQRKFAQDREYVRKRIEAFSKKKVPPSTKKDKQVVGCLQLQPPIRSEGYIPDQEFLDDLHEHVSQKKVTT